MPEAKTIKLGFQPDRKVRAQRKGLRIDPEAHAIDGHPCPGGFPISGS
jgi:hypothetical protein